MILILKPHEDSNTIAPTDISVSDVETEIVDTTSFDSFIDDNEIAMDGDIYEYGQFMCATPLINNISTVQQTVEVTNT